MSPWWLVLIVPACIMFGWFWACICVASSRDAGCDACALCRAANWGICKCRLHGEV